MNKTRMDLLVVSGIVASLTVLTAAPRVAPGVGRLELTQRVIKGVTQWASGEVTVPARSASCIRGKVLNASDHAPVSWAPVRLETFAERSASAPASQRAGRQHLMTSQVASASGEFAFCGLAAGEFSVSVLAAPGFEGTPRPQHLRVQPGSDLSTEIHVRPLASIAGCLTGGALAARTRIAALKSADRDQGQLIQSSRTVSPDGSGCYHLTGLSAGAYYVVADPNTTVRDDREGEPEWTLSYYPGVADFRLARSVEVAPGTTVRDIDFSLTRGRALRITGRAFDSAGAPLPTAKANISLRPATDHGPVLTRSVGVGMKGEFEITGVNPGAYILSIVLSGNDGGVSETVAHAITLTDADLTLTLQTTRGAVIRGRVEIDEAERLIGPQGSRVRVRATSVGAAPPSGAREAYGVVAVDGTFTLANVHGPVLLSATQVGTALKGVSISGADFTAKPIVLTGQETVDDVRITLTAAVGAINGMVMTNDGTPSTHTSVLVFLDDLDRWRAGRPFVHVSRTIDYTTSVGQQPGEFRAPALLPGNYLVAAVEGAAADRLLTTQRLFDTLRRHAVKASVRPGHTTQVELRAVRLE